MENEFPNKCYEIKLNEGFEGGKKNINPLAPIIKELQQMNSSFCFFEQIFRRI